MEHLTGRCANLKTDAKESIPKSPKEGEEDKSVVDVDVSQEQKDAILAINQQQEDGKELLKARTARQRPTHRLLALMLLIMWGTI